MSFTALGGLHSSGQDSCACSFKLGVFCPVSSRLNLWCPFHSLFWVPVPQSFTPGCTSTPLVSYLLLHTISEDACLFVSFPKDVIYPNISQCLYLPPVYIILLSLLCPLVPGTCSCHLAELLQGFEIAASGFPSFLQLPFQHPHQTDQNRLMLLSQMMLFYL